MFYIKLENDMSLTITQKEPIYRGDNLKEKICYLVPPTIGDIDTLSATIYLCYIRSDGTADIVTLERKPEKYNGQYYQYVFPVGAKLTRYAGEVCTWMYVLSGPVGNPTIAKSGECILHVQESKNIDSYLSDQQIAAIYRLQHTVSGKADNIIADETNSTIQLSADGSPIGNVIDLSKLTGDDVIHFDEVQEIPADDDVIHF